MRILFLTTGRQTPSSRFRVLQYVPHLRRLGHRCTVAASHPPMYRHYGWLGWRRSTQLRRLLRRLDLRRLDLQHFDAVYLERELFDDDSWDLEAAFRRRSRTMLLDVDDAIFLRHPAKFEAVARMCDAVVAGNRLLQQRIEPLNPNVAVIPTCVDLERYSVKPAKSTQSRPVLGWTGTSSNLPYLGMIAEPLRRLAREVPFELRIIADDAAPLRKMDFSGVDLRFVRWRERTEIRDISAFDIGLMPLPDTEWTRYKCGLKIIQYMALGVPAVASPVGANTEIVGRGENGLLAKSADDWQQALTQLLLDREYRTVLGSAGRATVESRYSILAQLPRWVEVLEATVRGGRG